MSRIHPHTHESLAEGGKLDPGDALRGGLGSVGGGGGSGGGGISLPIDAVDVTVTDAGGYFTGTDVEAVLQELGLDVSALGTPAGGHMHVVSEAHLSNGSGTTYTLDQAFEVGSVIAWNTTTLARLGVTETQPDQATVSAAGSSGDTIMFDYAATVV